MKPHLTQVEYTGFQDAYDHFNAALFLGKLPQCLITLQRKNKAAGYFWPYKFKGRRKASTYTDEIALNPDFFAKVDDVEIMQTLVHEMCHQWQHHFGNPSRAGYHNTEWALKMEAVGLMPSSTGKHGGKKTGQSMSDYVITGGPFDFACREFLKSFRPNWESLPSTMQVIAGNQGGKGQKGNTNGGKVTVKPKPRPKSKIKYSCLDCGQNAWAKPASKLICGTCFELTGKSTPMSELEATG